MKSQTFDKAKWHYDTPSAPTGISHEAGATHIAFFLRWCVEKDFASKEMVREHANELEQIKNKTLDGREFILDCLDGAFTTDELNTRGVLFAIAYYGRENTKFAQTYGTYTGDYDELVKSKLTTTNIDSSDDSAYFYVENSEENYEIVKSVIDKRYEEFLSLKKRNYKSGKN
ncbi:MAG: hypothetical protein LBS73_03175 [Campylobacteraceae bacterium]|jgi:hypothetical protein|nr:hypothetical protein [Campylobacteraceae bacterium]